MPRNARFWRNVTLIGLAHAVLIVAFVRWSRETKDAGAQNVVWMNGGSGDGVATEKKNLPPKDPVRPPPPRVESKTEPKPAEDSEEDRPVLTSARSDIQLPTPKPSPTLTPKATPKPSPKVKGTPKPTPSPIRTPKPKPKPTPKPSPKKITLAKASPKPSARPTPEESEKSEEDSDVDAEKKKIAKEALKQSNGDEATKKANVAEGAGGKGSSSGANGHAGGAGAESQFGWYGSMLHDRFYSEWVQPTSVSSEGPKNSVLVKIRIEKDGHVSNFEIVRPSGNEALDESVNAVAKRVTQVDSLPAGLGNGDHYDVKINFELNSDQ
jgi:TonB family protein